MTIADLIHTLLENIRGQWYADRVREFKRDERALTKAIARYGYRCEERGWDFTPAQIQRDILELLLELKRQGIEPHYFPVYLQGAVDKRLRIRAEEYSAKAKSSSHQVTRAIKGVRPVKAVVQQTTTEVLANLYRDLKRRRPTRRKPKPQTQKEPSLL